MFRHSIIISLAFICNFSVAENIYESKRRIDIWKEKSLKNASTTEEILSVNAEAYKKWDKALNVVYRSLINKIPEKDKKLLRESQRNWISYRDSEFKFMPVHILRAGGSLSRVIYFERKVAFIRNRVIELEAYEFIHDSPP